MTHDRNAEAQELTPEDLERVAGGSPISDAVKVLGEMLSNVSKTRSEITMTFVRNARA
jgi:hypothetical protein